jgi:hypothetical protein
MTWFIEQSDNISVLFRLRIGDLTRPSLCFKSGLKNFISLKGRIVP